MKFTSRQNKQKCPDMSRIRHFLRLTSAGGKGYTWAMDDMMGGFFAATELQEHGDFPWAEGPGCTFVSSGRAALELLLRNLPRRPRCLWVPRMACDTLLQPAEHLGLPVARYHCDEQLRPQLPPEAGAEDALILINYFGLTEEAVAAAAAVFPGAVLVDATTALHAPLPPHADGIFYSFRKFLPVADGGAAVASFPLAQLPAETDDSCERERFLHLRAAQGAHAAAAAAQAAEDSLAEPMKHLSPQTRARLRGISCEAAASRRRENYRLLHAALAPLNRLSLPSEPPVAPMCYPFVSGIPDLRDSLIDAGIALPLYWPEVIAATEAHETENRLARALLPLPLDQRYTAADMQRLLRLIGC